VGEGEHRPGTPEEHSSPLGGGLGGYGSPGGSEPGGGYGSLGGYESRPPDLGGRVGSILDAVEREAAQLQAQAREDAGRYLEYAKRQIDGMVAERQRMLASLSDELIAKAESVLNGLEEAGPVRAGFENLVRALGETAQRLASHGGDSIQMGLPEWGNVPPPPPPPPPPSAPPERTPHEATGPATAIPSQHHAFQYEYPPLPTGTAPPPPTPGPAAPAGPPRPGHGLDSARLVAIQMATAGSTRAQVETHLREALAIAEPRPILDEVFGWNTPADARVPWTAESG
jgi:hypothetical protein